MPVETGDYLDDLDQTQPQDTELERFGAGYFRFLKKAIKQSFPNITGAMTATHTVLNNLTAALVPASATVVNAAAVVNGAKSANIASAGSIDLAAIAGNFSIITGTTAITALGTVQAGARRLVQTQSALTITHNGTSLILPNGYDINTFAGEFLEFLSLGSGNWQLISPRPAIGMVDYRAVAAAPSGWLFADGTAISRTTYSGLFKLLVTDQSYSSQTFTVTIAAPGVFTKATHGFSNGERIRLATSGALPTGLDVTTDYFVTIIDANTFKVSTTRANYLVGTFVTTTGSQSGTHTYTQSLYGLGDGSTTFNLPDLRDSFIRGRASSGRTIASLQADAMQGHYHFFWNSTSGDTITTPSYNALAPSTGALAGGNTAGTLGDSFGVTGPRTDGTNGTPRTASESRPVNMAGYPIIKF